MISLSFLFVYYTIYLATSIVTLTLRNGWIKSWNRHDELLTVLISIMAAGCLSLLYSHEPVLALVNIFITITLLALSKYVFKNYSYSGVNFYLANFLMTFVGIAWGVNFMSHLDISMMTRILLFATSPLLVLTLPVSFVLLVENYDILTRDTWLNPRHPRPVKNVKTAPMVSIHVPVHSEPAKIVIETLQKIARLDYENFEVIVIDNNTTDPNLWKPVQVYCKSLGRKFKFYHVENLKGAKAGALNMALTLTNPKAEIISIIDADYHTEPGFLKELVGHFENKKMGFVQTPHDYRGWKKNLYLTMCYWEYKIFFHANMIALSERGAGITVGTMCLIRKQALQDAGGWAEWCVTEDSELAIRIHNAGYASAYVDKTYGRGLIPDTFEAYKKQRYRWTAGPVQELKHHIKDYLGLSKKTSQWSMLQRVHHLNHGLNNVLIGTSIPFTFFSLALVASMVFHKEIIGVPFELWLAATITLGSTLLLDVLMHKVTLNPTLMEVIGKIVASKALAFVIAYASFKTTLDSSAKWTRTNKFKSKHSYKAAIYAAKEETLIGFFIALFTVIAYMNLPYTGFVLMLLIGLIFTTLSCFSALFISLLNVWSMKEKHLKLEKDFSIPYFNLNKFSYAAITNFFL
jgi:cellulose synthase/poly-beta-1,6-N-acetylglucosamine synthase-like glycosyltransferase